MGAARHLQQHMKRSSLRLVCALVAVAVICCTVFVSAGYRLGVLHNERIQALAQCNAARSALSRNLKTLRNASLLSDDVAPVEANIKAAFAGNPALTDFESSRAHAATLLAEPSRQCPADGSIPELSALTTTLRGRAQTIRSHARELTHASDKVANLTNAGPRRTLATAVSQAQWWVDFTAGQVSDESTRISLSEAIGNARNLLDGNGIVMDRQPYIQQVAALNAAMDAVAVSHNAKLGVDCSKVACVALTFDDGPNAKNTPVVIDVLRRTKTTATFFTVGEHVAKPDEGKLTVSLTRAGYPIGNHSWSHANLAALGETDLTAQLQRTNDELEQTTGYAPLMIRPPYSSWNDAVRQRAIAMNAAIINYDTIGVDWARTAPQVRANVVRWTKPGSIILLHDPQDSTAQSIESIITDLKARGFVFVTIPQLLGGLPKPGWVYYSRTGYLTPDQPWTDSSYFTAEW